MSAFPDLQPALVHTGYEIRDAGGCTVEEVVLFLEGELGLFPAEVNDAGVLDEFNIFSNEFLWIPN